MNLCTQYAELAGFDFDILPTVQVGMVYFYRFRENISERTLLVTLALIRAFGAMRLRDIIKFPITICRTENLSGTQIFVRNTSRQNPLLRAIIGVWKLISEVHTIGGDDMADIAKKISNITVVK